MPLIDITYRLGCDHKVKTNRLCTQARSVRAPNLNAALNQLVEYNLGWITTPRGIYCPTHAKHHEAGQ